jgi:hypothetical protein
LQQLNGITCLATPFISATSRDIDAILSPMGHDPAGNVFVVIPFISLAIALMIGILTNGPLGVAAFLGLWFYGALREFRSLSPKRASRVKERQTKLVEPYRFERISCPILSIRIQGDEALAHIRTMSVVGDLPGHLVSAVGAAGGLAFLAFLFLPLLVPVACTADLIASDKAQPMGAALASLADNLVGWFVAVVVVTPILLVASVIVRGLVRLTPLSWGELFRTGLYVKFSVSRKPTKLPRFSEAIIPAGTGTSMLVHSQVYESPETAARVAAFLAESESYVQGISRDDA